MTTAVLPATPTLSGIGGFFTKLEMGFQKDEAWVVAEVTKGWHLLQSAEQTVAVDIHGIFQWVQSHQSSILAIFQEALQAAAIIGSVVPGSAGVATAITAINAATAAVNVLGKAVIDGSTPLSTAVSAYHAVKDAQTAVNGVIKQATTKPTISLAAATTAAAAAAAAHSGHPVE